MLPIIEIVEIKRDNADYIAPLLADFRVLLKSFKGVKADLDVNSAIIELREFADAGFPMFAAAEGGEYVGYIVCRIDEPCVWVEHIYIRADYRRQGVASMLYAKAEAIAKSMGEDTVFNFVHPNNDAMIAFLRSHGYTVLNMIEIRKPYEGESLTKIKVGNHEFDY